MIDREELVPPDVRFEVLLLEEVLLPVGAVVPAGVEEDLVREDDERIARLLVERVEPGVAADGACLLVEDLLEVGRDRAGLEPDPAADLLSEQVGRAGVIHGSRSSAWRRRTGRT